MGAESDHHRAAVARRTAVLCVLDGWGYRDGGDDNAIAVADTPCWDRLWRDFPSAFLNTSGGAVGLPEGQMGNSEVGHMNIGAGRVVLQDFPRIEQAIETGALATNPELTAAMGRIKAASGICHLIGLVSPGGVHSHQNQIVALAQAMVAGGISVRIHAILDGRDTPPKSALNSLGRFVDMLPAGAEIVTVCGRYFAMDRDNRWDRVEKAYNLICSGEGDRYDDPLAAVAGAYQRDETDEFIEPMAIGDYAGMADEDGLLAANFRADRMREILTALLDPEFDAFNRRTRLQFSAAVGMVQYSEKLDSFLATLFAPIELSNVLGRVLADAGLRQLRLAETEKYAHVTFFLNGGEERVFDGEDRILVPSPKVATYDLQPEMSAVAVAGHLVEAIGSGRYDCIIVNFANPDMVGHTGDMAAAVKAVETVDRCLVRLVDAVEAAEGLLLVTADHGNIEMMRDPSTGAPHTAHTTNPVPVVFVDGDRSALAPRYHLVDGRLCDLAPTLLGLLGIALPAEMNGKTLLVPDVAYRTGSKRHAGH